MAVSRTSLVIIIFALQVVYAASQYAIESDPGQDVTLRCALEAAGEVVVQFWQYANSEDPLQMCRHQIFETLTTEWPAYGVIEFGASVTPEFKSRLLLDVNFDLTLVNVSQGDSGCYQCGLTVDSLKFLDNVTILIVANNSDSGGITEDPTSIPYQTILYISLGIALFIVLSIVLVVIVIRKRDRLAAVKRNVRANPDGNEEEMQASVPCLAGVEDDKMDVTNATLRVGPPNLHVGSHMTVEVTVPGRQTSVVPLVTLWVEKTGGEVIYEVTQSRMESGKFSRKILVKDLGQLEVKAKVCSQNTKDIVTSVIVQLKGRFVKQFSQQMYNPHDIIKDGDAFIVADKDNHQVQIFNTDFQPLGQFSPYNSFLPYGVACTGSTFVVTDIGEGCVVEFTNTRNFSQIKYETFGHNHLEQPLGIAVHRTGNIYVSDGKKHCIVCFDSNGGFLLKIGSRGSSLGGMDTPWFIAFNSKQNLVVAEFGNKRIQIWDVEKPTALQTIDVTHSDKIWDCRGLAVDDNDNIYVTARGGGFFRFLPHSSEETVFVYTRTGNFLGKFGSGFNFVRGLTVTREGQDIKAYVVDGANHCISAYEM